MALNPRLHPEAEEELENTVDWYDNQQFGLGEDLLEAAERTIQLNADSPRIGSVLLGWDREPVVRSKLLARFPYRVFYSFTDTDLLIIPFAHNRRRPRYWERRL